MKAHSDAQSESDRTHDLVNTPSVPEGIEHEACSNISFQTPWKRPYKASASTHKAEGGARRKAPSMKPRPKDSIHPTFSPAQKSLQQAMLRAKAGVMTYSPRLGLVCRDNSGIARWGVPQNMVQDIIENVRALCIKNRSLIEKQVVDLFDNPMKVRNPDRNGFNASSHLLLLPDR